MMSFPWMKGVFLKIYIVFLVYHYGHYHACSPAVDSVVVFRVAEEEFRSFVVERCNMIVVIYSWNVVLTQSEVDDFEGFFLRVD